MPAVRCPICLSHLSINDFVVFPCGHGLCNDCKGLIFKDSARQKCPNCRIHIRVQDAYPVFLELVNAGVTTSSLLHHLDKMDHKTPLLSLKKVGKNLGMVLQGTQPELNATTALIKAIEDFNERVIPIFDEVEVQSQQVNALTELLLDSRQENEDLLAIFQSKSIQLERELEETKEDNSVLSQVLREIHASSAQSEERASQLAAENRRYKNLLENVLNSSAREERRKDKSKNKWWG